MLRTDPDPDEMNECLGYRCDSDEDKESKRKDAKKRFYMDLSPKNKSNVLERDNNDIEKQQAEADGRKGLELAESKRQKWPSRGDEFFKRAKFYYESIFGDKVMVREGSPECSRLLRYKKSDYENPHFRYMVEQIYIDRHNGNCAAYICPDNNFYRICPKRREAEEYSLDEYQAIVGENHFIAVDGPEDRASETRRSYQSMGKYKNLGDEHRPFENREFDNLITSLSGDKEIDKAKTEAETVRTSLDNKLDEEIYRCWNSQSKQRKRKTIQLIDGTEINYVIPLSCYRKLQRQAVELNRPEEESECKINDDDGNITRRQLELPECHCPDINDAEPISRDNLSTRSSQIATCDFMSESADSEEFLPEPKVTEPSSEREADRGSAANPRTDFDCVEFVKDRRHVSDNPLARASLPSLRSSSFFSEEAPKSTGNNIKSPAYQATMDEFDEEYKKLLKSIDENVKCFRESEKKFYKLIERYAPHLYKRKKDLQQGGNCSLQQPNKEHSGQRSIIYQYLKAYSGPPSREKYKDLIAFFDEQNERTKQIIELQKKQIIKNKNFIDRWKAERRSLGFLDDTVRKNDRLEKENEKEKCHPGCEYSKPKKLNRTADLTLWWKELLKTYAPKPASQI